MNWRFYSFGEGEVNYAIDERNRKIVVWTQQFLLLGS